jgi:hypothetical protein
MKRLAIGPACLVCLVHAACASAVSAAPLFKKPEPAPVSVPWEELSPTTTATVKAILDRPTVFAKGPAETFPCAPEQYYWLLDNPDRAVTAWRRLGAKCVSIQRRGQGKFGYVDEQGTDISWEIIHQSANVRIWYAEGKVKPSPVMPLVPVKVMIILHCNEGKTQDGTVVMQHQAEVVVHTDSKAAAAVTKMMGQSAPKLAEQGLSQLGLFFSALSYYLDRHPDRVDMLFRPEGATVQPAKKAGN